MRLVTGSSSTTKIRAGSPPAALITGPQSPAMIDVGDGEGFGGVAGAVAGLAVEDAPPRSRTGRSRKRCFLARRSVIPTRASCVAVDSTEFVPASLAETL